MTTIPVSIIFYPVLVKCFRDALLTNKPPYQFTGKPGMLDLKGKAKWNAWNDKKGVSQDQAKEDYIKMANQLATKYA